jgi:hypothetical protein
LEKAEHPALNDGSFHRPSAGQLRTVLAKNKVSMCFYVVLKMTCGPSAPRGGPSAIQIFGRPKNIKKLCWSDRLTSELSAHDGWTVRTTAKAHRQVRQRRFRHGLGWGLFLKVSGSVGSLFW